MGVKGFLEEMRAMGWAPDAPAEDECWDVDELGNEVLLVGNEEIFIGRSRIEARRKFEEWKNKQSAPESHPVEGERAIVVGATWKQSVPPGIHVEVLSIVNGVQYQWRGEQGYDDVSVKEFRMHFTWVSDPDPPATKETP